jgi:hypothetical protein
MALSDDDAFRVLVDDPTLMLGAWRRVLIARWHAVPTPDKMRALRVHVRALVARVGTFSAINFFEARDATGIPDDARQEVVVTQREFDAAQECLATVIEGGGFWAATVRSVAAGMALVSRTRFPQRVFSDPQAALGWVAERTTGIGHERLGDFARVVTDACRRPRAPAPGARTSP